MTWEASLLARVGRGVRLSETALMGELTRVDAALGSPAARARVIHVVGTNGKGSTSAMIAHALRAQGRRVGLFTSPHLHRVAERIRVQGELISDEALERHLNRVAEVEQSEGAALSFFEVLTFIALLHFESQGVQDVVLEAGLGGRLDSTCIRTSAVTVFTPFGLDHEQYLGPGIESICREKIAVMHKDAPVFSAPQPEWVKGEMQKRAVQLGCSLTWAKPLKRPPASMSGTYQCINAGLAVDVVRYLLEDVRSDPERERQADEYFSECRWPGRFEQVEFEAGAWVLFDVAHNLEGVEAVVDSISSMSKKPTRIYFSAMADKPIASMLAALRQLGVEIQPVQMERTGAHDWATESWGARQALSVDEALRQIRSELQVAGRVLVIGSHFLVAALRSELLGVAGERVEGMSDPLDRTFRSH